MLHVSSLKKLLGAITNLEVFPRSGRAVPEIEDQAFRELLVQGYRVVYLVTGEMEEAEVEILTIAHGKQDLMKKLARRG
jgi:plasmid stabilization system protein ParE